jgi:hypothetical protein
LPAAKRKEAAISGAPPHSAAKALLAPPKKSIRHKITAGILGETPETAKFNGRTSLP